MDLLLQTLKGIDDATPLAERMTSSSSVKGLVSDYNALTAHNSMLAVITGDKTGAELKYAIGQLLPEEQLMLLKRYSDVVHGVVPMIDPAEAADNRKLKSWLVRFFAVSLTLALFVCLGILLALMVRGNILPSEGLLSSMFTSIVEILKLIFLTNK